MWPEESQLDFGGSLTFEEFPKNLLPVCNVWNSNLLPLFARCQQCNGSRDLEFTTVCNKKADISTEVCDVQELLRWSCYIAP